MGAILCGILGILAVYIFLPPRLALLVRLDSIRENQAADRAAQRIGMSRAEIEAPGAHEYVVLGYQIALADERAKAPPKSQVAADLMKPRWASVVDEPFRREHLWGVVLLGTLQVLWLGTRRSSGARRWGVVAMWASMAVVSVLFAIPFLLSDPVPASLSFGGFYITGCAFSLVLLVLPSLFVRTVGPPVKAPPGTLFDALPYRRLPLGTLNRGAVTVMQLEENQLLLDGKGGREKAILDTFLTRLRGKGLTDTQFWRCNQPTADRLLLLVDRRVGFGQHVWTLVDVVRPGGGKDLTVRFYRLVPRHLDVWDVTLIRHTVKPLLVVVTIAMALADSANSGRNVMDSLAADRWSTGAFGITLLVGTLGAIAAFAAFLAEAKELTSLILAVAVLLVVLGLVATYVFNSIEANKPGTAMERASLDQFNMTKAAFPP